MDIDSIALKSDFIILGRTSLIRKSDEYISVHTPQNPDFHWGNFLIYQDPPTASSLPEWERDFQKEFPRLKHRAFTWIKEIKIPHISIEHYEIERLICLSADKLERVAQINQEVTVRKIQTEEDWQKLEHHQMQCLFLGNEDKSFEVCLKRKFKDYRSLVHQGAGDWFVAELDGKWVGDLGLFYEATLGSYENVTTYPKYEGRGIAHALVFKAGEYALNQYPITQLSIVAEAGSRAYKIYHNLGFKAVGSRVNLYKPCVYRT